MTMVRRLATGAVFLALTFGYGWSSAGAATPDFVCGTLGQSIVKPDGSILSLGQDVTGCDPEAGSRDFLFQMKSDGTPDADFSDGGVKFLDDFDPVVLMRAGTDGSVLATGNSLIRFRADGEFDAEFGEAGLVRDIPQILGAASISSAVTQPDGKILVAGSTTEGVSLARFTADGDLDGLFGAGGVAKPPVPPSVGQCVAGGIGLDDSGRILVNCGYVVMRLLGDGGLDLEFGPGDTGFSAEPVSDRGSFLGPGAGPFVDGDGTFRLYLPVYEIYGIHVVGSRFDSDGAVVGAPVDFSGLEYLTETADGGLVSMPPYVFRGTTRLPFFLHRETATGEKLPGFSSIRSGFVPGSNQDTRGITYSPQDDSLILTGNAGNSMIAVKVDARTGRLDADFGTGGAVLFPGNSCPRGVAPPVGDPIPWSRCVLRAPEFTKARIVVGDAASRQPSLRVRMRITRAQRSPGQQVRRLVAELPDALKLRRGGAVRRSVKIRTAMSGEAVTRIVDGRKIVVVFKPKSTDNKAFEVTVRMKRGSLKPLPRKIRPKRLRFDLDAQLSGPSRYWAPGSTTKVVVPRLVRGQRVSSSSR